MSYNEGNAVFMKKLSIRGNINIDISKVKNRQQPQLIHDISMAIDETINVRGLCTRFELDIFNVQAFT